MPDQLPYDYMHLVLQGHCKWLFVQFFKTKKSPAFIGTDFDNYANVQRHLELVKEPHFFNRKPRNLDHILKWKSVEIKIFAFYISIPLLMNNLSLIYFYHYCCYIFAIRLFYEPIESDNDTTLADEILKEYIKMLGQYYNDGAYDFTVHVHEHLASKVRLHGPLKSHSQFVFEVINAVLQLSLIITHQNIFHLKGCSF